MIIACPDCNGKLSTAAPTCPHCGYIQKAVQQPPPNAAAAPHAPTEIAAPSKQALREAARRQFMQWNYDSFWPMAFGMVIMLAILGVAAIVVFFVRSR